MADQLIRGVIRRPIRLLPPEITARIAAGEVIERPASVVKELVENALDADSRSIRVEVHGGGLSLIRVSDDGLGIPAREIELACQRHATSKLPDYDLARVESLGFRGEALPSIATTSELSILSAADDTGLGHRIVLRDGVVVAEEPAPRPRGTTVTVRRLFENFAPRRASANGASVEVAQIAQTVRRLALAAPHVRLDLSTDRRLVTRTHGSGDLSETLLDVYGTTLGDFVVPLASVEAAHARLWGAIVSPDVTRSTRAQVNVIVNGRWVQPRRLLAAIEATYRPLLPRGRHPILVLIVETSPEFVDVNVHPTKLEVRLLEERALGDAAAQMLRDAIGARPVELRLGPHHDLGDLPTLHRVAESVPGYDATAPITTPGLPPLRLLGQLQRRLIVLESDAGMLLVDQHRAHERILYEHLLADHSPVRSSEHELAEPLVIELSPALMRRFRRRLDELRALGFCCEEFGKKTFLVRSAPLLPGVLSSRTDDGLGHLGEQDALIPTLRDLACLDEDGGEGWRERLLVQLSCRTAVRRGRELAEEEMRALLEMLGRCRSPAICPHGSPLLINVSGDTLTRQFHWG